MNSACRTVAFSLSFLVFSSCATVPPPSPPPSRSEFQETIIEPLAAKRAGEIIEFHQAQARLEAAKAKGNAWIANLLSRGVDIKFPGAGPFLRSLQGNPQTKLDQYLAWLETRRAPLKATLLDMYASWVTEEPDTLAFCYAGFERRYARQAGFPRLDDGPKPCPPVQITFKDLDN